MLFVACFVLPTGTSSWRRSGRGGSWGAGGLGQKSSGRCPQGGRCACSRLHLLVPVIPGRLTASPHAPPPAPVAVQPGRRPGARAARHGCYGGRGGFLCSGQDQVRCGWPLGVAAGQGGPRAGRRAGGQTPCMRGPASRLRCAAQAGSSALPRLASPGPQGGGAAGPPRPAPGGAAGGGAAEGGGGAGAHMPLSVACLVAAARDAAGAAAQNTACLRPACLHCRRPPAPPPKRAAEPPCSLPYSALPCRRQRPTRWLSSRRCWQRGPSRSPSGSEGGRRNDAWHLRCQTNYIASLFLTHCAVPPGCRCMCSVSLGWPAHNHQQWRQQGARAAVCQVPSSRQQLPISQASPRSSTAAPPSATTLTPAPAPAGGRPRYTRVLRTCARGGKRKGQRCQC